MPDLTPDREVASREAIARRPERKSRGLKALGLLGFLCLGLMLVAAATAIAAGASDRDGTVWLAVAAVVFGLLAVGLLITSRVLLRQRAAGDGDRAHQDPIQPETTAEEAERYEERFHGFPVDHAGKHERGREDARHDSGGHDDHGHDDRKA
ncbi:hypothetical protein IA539_20810 [Gordonia sp. zg691]|uniref:Uncharacterized protein n=1 Tax=Gordonia jinghuaiqii TaxID=2758710 RepID=A0A7D7LSX1_9ACTN|nr:hypothetical protein [Gordonia jinghuaiqii]MBD0863618.1 hypothetical protein [Gordonia jinghuaiqii]MCR5979354.1 hypothetical protein [Gordonia jinghuaiqii]QMT01137.1 hypothetical protein H1R19_20135 [Gordonia jinghuaiqii]